ncbi:MAG: hypothetical protein A3G38_02135 [Omnitrophica WOR_2 bacterium RIFCSPLOWO2_12_FULL_51_8]|nr:MAG: hypothetical protein A3G38_02135 [Omnitrophica WOR_2 bacterium RIFCSPLOWO2_12_FULL_51_8]
MNELELYVDGASKGNPGPAGVGVVICRGKETVKNISSYIGKNTNNAAEYTALIYALEEALALKADKLKIYTDSELVYRQIRQEYKVKNPVIAGLYARARRLMQAFRDVSVVYIPRGENRGADKLANLAVKNALGPAGLVR